jgi:WD40 repeat protein
MARTKQLPKAPLRCAPNKALLCAMQRIRQFPDIQLDIAAFLNLPDDIIYRILDFLASSSVLSFDSAICNQELRLVWLKIFRRYFSPPYIFDCKIALPESATKIYSITQLSNNDLAIYTDKSIEILEGFDHVKFRLNCVIPETDSQPLLLKMTQSKLASTGHDNHAIYLWNIDSAEKCKSTKIDGGVRSLVLIDSPVMALVGHNEPISALIHLDSSNQIVSGSEDGVIKVWDCITGKCLMSFEGHNFEVRSLLQLKDGRLVSGSYRRRSNCGLDYWGDFESDIKVWDLTGMLDAKDFEDSEDYCDLIFPADPEIGCVYTEENRVSVLQEVEVDIEYIRRWFSDAEDSGSDEGSCNFSRAITLIVAGLHSGNVVILDPTTGDFLKRYLTYDFYWEDVWETMEPPSNVEVLAIRPIPSLDLSPKKRFVIGVERGAVKIWRMFDSQCQRLILTGCKTLRDVIILSDGRILSYGIDEEHKPIAQIWKEKKDY